MKQTAVQWLQEQLIKKTMSPIEAIQQAKSMEKEQIIDAYDRGYNEYDIYRNGQNYYIEIYEQNKQR